MTYTGAIKFMDVDPEYFWRAESLGFSDEQHTITGELGKLRECKVDRRGGECIITDFVTNQQKGQLKYDMQDGKLKSLEQFVMVGRVSKSGRYYVLVVELTSAKNEYARIGAGWVDIHFLSKVGREVTVV